MENSGKESCCISFHLYRTTLSLIVYRGLIYSRSAYIWYKDKEMQHCRGVIRNSLTPQGEYKVHNSPCRNKVSYPSSLLSWGAGE